VVEGFKTHYTDILQPDDYAFHTIHITVDEDHGGHVGEFAEQYLDTDAKRRSARAPTFAGAELTRRCWDNLASAAGSVPRFDVVPHLRRTRLVCGG
jgi:hypothetical protein